MKPSKFSPGDQVQLVLPSEIIITTVARVELYPTEPRRAPRYLLTHQDEREHPFVSPPLIEEDKLDFTSTTVARCSLGECVWYVKEHPYAPATIRSARIIAVGHRRVGPYAPYALNLLSDGAQLKEEEVFDSVEQALASPALQG